MENNKPLESVDNTTSVTTTSSSNSATVIVSENQKKLPKKQKVSKNTRSDKSKNRKTPLKKKRHIIIGKHLSNENGWTFSYSESENLREILIDFAKTVDRSLNKRKTIIYSEILANLNSGNNINIAFSLMEEFFGYKVMFIAECNKIFLDKDFTKELINKMKDNNDPLPF